VEHEHVPDRSIFIEDGMIVLTCGWVADDYSETCGYEARIPLPDSLPWEPDDPDRVSPVMAAWFAARVAKGVQPLNAEPIVPPR
jgi:hypothetical protein